MIARTSTRSRHQAVEIHIDELLLTGISMTRGQAIELQATVEAELTRLVMEQGLNRLATVTVASISTVPIQLTGDDNTSRLSQQIAQSIYSSLAAGEVGQDTSRPTPGAMIGRGTAGGHA